MSVARLRFVVDALQFMSAGQAELEGDTLRGLQEILEDACLQIGADRRHLLEKFQKAEKMNTEMTEDLAEMLWQRIPS